MRILTWLHSPAQIPDIDGRIYPASLAGRLYPRWNTCFPEENLLRSLRNIRLMNIFSYSDVTYQKVMSLGAIVNTAGANFVMGPRQR